MMSRAPARQRTPDSRLSPILIRNCRSISESQILAGKIQPELLLEAIPSALTLQYPRPGLSCGQIVFVQRSPILVVC